MSDYNSSLPIRTENNGDAAVKIVDGTITSQALAVAADGSIAVTDNGASLTVDALNLDIRDLSASQDNVAISDGTDTLAVNADGSINAVVTATNLDIRDLVFATDKVDVSGSTVALDAPTLAALESITVQNGAGASAVNIQDGGNSITVDATDLDIRDLSHAQDSVKVGDGTDFLAINADGSVNSNIRDASGAAFSALNPLPVTVTLDNAGDEINDYNTAAAVAAAGTSNHDYTVTALKTLILTQINASGSGKMKIEVQVETAAGSGVFNTKFVQFNSAADTNMNIELKSPIQVVAGARVRVIRTNRDLLAQDLYSTISGQEI